MTIDRRDRARTFKQLQNDLKEGKKVTQKELCLRYLLEYDTITPLEALEAFGCFRLSAVIFDLREEGYNIKTNINKDGKPYAIYELIEEEE